jgi:hypothetical protein
MLDEVQKVNGAPTTTCKKDMTISNTKVSLQQWLGGLVNNEDGRDKLNSLMHHYSFTPVMSQFKSWSPDQHCVIFTSPQTHKRAKTRKSQ